MILDFIPRLAGGGNVKEQAQQPVDASGHDEAGEEVEVVDVRRADGHLHADCADEAHKVDEQSAEVGSVPDPRHPADAVVRPILVGAVQLPEVEVPLAHEVVVAAHDAADGRQEDGVGGEIRGELAG